MSVKLEQAVQAVDSLAATCDALGERLSRAQEQSATK